MAMGKYRPSSTPHRRLLFQFLILGFALLSFMGDMADPASNISPKEGHERVIKILIILLQCNSNLISAYYYKYLHKVPCYNSNFMGCMWMRQLLDAKDGLRCMNAFQMEKHVLEDLRKELEENYGLQLFARMQL